MIAQRNYANFFSAKCDCCKRVRKVRTKIEVLEDNGALLGELTICPKCLKSLNFDKKQDSESQAMSEDNFEIFDEDEMDIDDFKKLGYEVQMI